MKQEKQQTKVLSQRELLQAERMVEMMIYWKESLDKIPMAEFETIKNSIEETRAKLYPKKKETKLCFGTKISVFEAVLEITELQETEMSNTA